MRGGALSAGAGRRTTIVEEDVAGEGVVASYVESRAAGYRGAARGGAGVGVGGRARESGRPGGRLSERSRAGEGHRCGAGPCLKVPRARQSDDEPVPVMVPLDKITMLTVSA